VDANASINAILSLVDFVSLVVATGHPFSHFEHHCKISFKSISFPFILHAALFLTKKTYSEIAKQLHSNYIYLYVETNEHTKLSSP
jgi:hypothetical protein